MPSELWKRTLADILGDPWWASPPYNSNKKSEFLNETRVFLDQVYKEFDSYNLKFHTDDRSLAKALWMLQVDALDTLRDCIIFLNENKHRIVGKMFRDILETLDLAEYLRLQGDGSNALNKWYNSKIIPHREYRDFIKGKNPNRANNLADFYSQLSKWTHHTYFALGYSYSRGEGDMLVYDSHSPLLVLPRTIAQYIWMIKELIKLFFSRVKESGIVTVKDINPPWE